MGSSHSKDVFQSLDDDRPFDIEEHQLIQRMNSYLDNLSKSQNKPVDIDKDKRQIEIENVLYDLTHFINKGGFGQVYKGKSRQTNETVAIKIMSNTPSIEQEIKNEIQFLRLTKKIEIENHPIIDYYGCQFTKQQICISMELAYCDLLTYWFNLPNDINGKEKFFFGIIIIVYVLRALTFLEKLNLIHGDIKPQNLVIVKYKNSFSIKLIDFGTIEKMDSIKLQLTVDADKAHTVFFASPEFLKRDSNHMIKRHLHKKSDAWAAGILFYVLFFAKFPWTDQFEYENFCNNPRSHDICVPKYGGYNKIIELLLKKDPNQRSSAKSTLLQMKDHPNIKHIIQYLNYNYCPIDDVCHIKISSDTHSQLGKLAQPGHFVDPSNSSRNKSLFERRACRYGQDCYRKDPDHRREFSHPTDNNYHRNDHSNNDVFHKQMCRYGSQCYNKDDEHRKKYIHPNGNKSQSINGRRDVQLSKQMCKYGNDCYNSEPDHLKKYLHLSDQNNQKSHKEKCWYGLNCSKLNDVNHRNKYIH